MCERERIDIKIICRTQLKAKEHDVFVFRDDKLAVCPVGTIYIYIYIHKIIIIAINKTNVMRATKTVLSMVLITEGRRSLDH